MRKTLNQGNACYDIDSLQELLPLGKNKLYELVHSKGFPKIVVGRKILIPKKAFDEWLEKACIEQRVV